MSRHPPLELPRRPQHARRRRRHHDRQTRIGRHRPRHPHRARSRKCTTEPGCQLYSLHQSGETFVFVEQWADDEALKAHSTAPGGRQDVHRGRRAPGRGAGHQDAAAGSRGRPGQGTAPPVTGPATRRKSRAHHRRGPRSGPRARGSTGRRRRERDRGRPVRRRSPACPIPWPPPEDLAATVKLVEDTGARIVAKQGDVRDRASLSAARAGGHRRARPARHRGGQRRYRSHAIRRRRLARRHRRQPHRRLQHHQGRDTAPWSSRAPAGRSC